LFNFIQNAEKTQTNKRHQQLGFLVAVPYYKPATTMAED